MTRSDRLDTPSQPPVPPDGTPVAEFDSILFSSSESGNAEPLEPACFADLNLDQVVRRIVAGRDEYALERFFHTPLDDPQAVYARHDVFRDLEQDALRAAVSGFAQSMRTMRQYLALAEKQRYPQEKQRWFLDAASIYCDAVSRLTDGLAVVDLTSQGFCALRDYLAGYRSSDRFGVLVHEVRDVLDGLARVRYTTRIKGGRVTVRAYDGEADYTVEVAQTFARFRQGDAEDHLVRVPDSGSMDHVEARIVQLVSRLFPTEFAALGEFCTRQAGFPDPRITRFDRELQFYLAYLEYMDTLQTPDLAFSYPSVSTQLRDVTAEGAFDIALATKLAGGGSTLVTNDFMLRGAERILVVTGPNQGGKTTFARSFGQLHYLASLGVPVPARRAQLVLADHIFTLFEEEEDISTLRGRLDNELVRLREILEHATDRSILVLNEVFASTTLADAVYLGSEVLRRIVDVGCATVWVTFIDELSRLGEETVSLVATVASDDPTRRTFKIVRRPADGRAYAAALADKYGLSSERLRSRIGR